MITTILIDIDNTLLDFDKCAALSIEAGFREYGLTFSENVLDTFTRINNELWSEIEKRTMTKQELYDVRWKRIFEALNITADGVKFEATFRKNLFESAATVDGAYELLEYLAPRYTVCAASNGPEREQNNRLKKAKMTGFLDYVFTSEGMGAPKPEKAFFDGCFSLLGGVNRTEAVLIGDSQTADIDGGRAYGITTVWYNHKGSTEPSRADYTAAKLTDVIDVLEKISETEQRKEGEKCGCI